MIERMSAKQTIRLKTVQWIAENRNEFDSMHVGEIMERLQDSLFVEMMEVWMQGVGVGANLAAECEELK